MKGYGRTIRGRHLGVCGVLLVSLLLSACGSKQGGQSDMPALLIPENEDTQPLTPAELAALKSTGQIDRNVPASAMPAVTAQYKHFLHKGRRTMEVFSQRSGNYLGYARRVFRSRGMPEELAYLAIVESGYRADAQSRAGAAGAWQFMPYTGMKYGLAQDWWMDERLDPYKATEAAADYLQKLYGDFRDWPTAIAAYNAGEGKMRRAKEGTGARNFYEVCERNERLDDKAQLRPETLQYVPRFVAISKIMRNLGPLGFAPVNHDAMPQVERLTVRPGTDLMALSKAAGMRWPDFQAANRHQLQAVSSTERSTFVYVPRAQAGQAQAFLQRSGGTFANWRPAKVATSADSWEKIARRSGVSVAQLQTANGGKSKIFRGETVLVPRNANMSERAVAAVDKRGKAPAAGTGRSGSRDKAAGSVHVLASGETLYGVARKYGVSVGELQAANDIDNPGKIRVGQTLRIPGNEQRPARAVAQAGKNPSGKLGKGKSGASTYTVKANDSLWNIARRHNVSVDDLKRWNDVDERSLRVGDKLVVSAR
ncbi:MAG TPA: LysM peptidoglycan-binding domain-containing protein [Candidatus Desulfovibrio intestinavium]|uniref:LysM peptidoglycan-binding domain-containing protein n=1 Tax=Candidatus Desulfovibrio intestinavium TaxID=2838534 RepID=A0A9D2HME6_9BACT|nr:LysM peptidoglycan-binding domain-containing protein [Candidatus Desulfovibrio intestinavium]